MKVLNYCSLLAGLAATQLVAQDKTPTAQPSLVKRPPPHDARSAADGSSNPTAPFKRAEVAEFDRLRSQSNVFVLDVRTPEEFAEGHLPMAGLLDIRGTNFLVTAAKLDRSKLYLVNCAAGGRSAKACQQLSTLGFTNVVNLEGGFTAWKKSKPEAISKDAARELPQIARPTMHLHSPGDAQQK